MDTSQKKSSTNCSPKPVWTDSVGREFTIVDVVIINKNEDNGYYATVYESSYLVYDVKVRLPRTKPWAGPDDIPWTVSPSECVVVPKQVANLGSEAINMWARLGGYWYD